MAMRLGSRCRRRGSAAAIMVALLGFFAGTRAAEALETVSPEREASEAEQRLRAAQENDELGIISRVRPPEIPG